jgi:hypothetical protein
MRRRFILAAISGAITLLATIGPASAGQVCAGYSATTPAGGGGATPCLPISPFTQRMSGGNCQGIPPAHVAVCIVFRVDMP